VIPDAGRQRGLRRLWGGHVSGVLHSRGSRRVEEQPVHFLQRVGSDAHGEKDESRGASYEGEKAKFRKAEKVMQGR